MVRRESTHLSTFTGRVISGVVMALALAAPPSFALNTPAQTLLTDETPRGAVVDTVTPDGPAAKAGISAHDIIVAIEGTPVQSMKQIIDDLARHKPGDTMELTLARASDGARTEVTMTLGANPRDASRPYMGLSVIVFMLLVPEGEPMPSEERGPPGI